MSGTIEFDKNDEAYLRAADALEYRFPEAAKHLRDLVYEKYRRREIPDHEEPTPDWTKWTEIAKWLKERGDTLT